jgi:hypothetical protein
MSYYRVQIEVNIPLTKTSKNLVLFHHYTNLTLFHHYTNKVFQKSVGVYKIYPSKPGARIRIPRSVEGDTNSGSGLRGLNLVYHDRPLEQGFCLYHLTVHRTTTSPTSRPASRH